MIEAARPRDLAGIRWLLEFEKLPVDDVTDELLPHFLVLRDVTGVVGAVAVQPLGRFALLRSLVVSEDHRRYGIGRHLVIAAEKLARDRGHSAVYLLTTSAESYFASHGYRVISRADAPAEVRSSSQFSQLCPSSAVLMVKP